MHALFQLVSIVPGTVCGRWEGSERGKEGERKERKKKGRGGREKGKFCFSANNLI